MCKGCCGDTARALEAETKPGQEPGARARQKERHRPEQRPLLEPRGLCHLIPGAGEI